MNGREAIQAMLDGKEIVAITDVGRTRWRLGNRGFELFSGYSQSWEPYPFMGSQAYELVEANPYEEGAYAWAKEEHRRGHDVTNDDPNGITYCACTSWDVYAFCDSEFETRTWRRA
jgi:hypothetical protein